MPVPKTGMRNSAGAERLLDRTTAGALLCLALALGACSTAPPAAPLAPVIAAAPQERATRVPIVHRSGSTFMVDVSIAGVCCFPFMVDSGASDVSISPALFAAMVRGGYINQASLIDVVTYTTASGSVQGLRFRLPPLGIGGLTVHDVVGSVTPNIPDNMLLLGQSFLRRFRSWSIDNETHELVLR